MAEGEGVGAVDTAELRAKSRMPTTASRTSTP
jgi:hypothetical protein